MLYGNQEDVKPDPRFMKMSTKVTPDKQIQLVTTNYQLKHVALLKKKLFWWLWFAFEEDGEEFSLMQYYHGISWYFIN